MDSEKDSQRRVEIAVLQQMGLRWAVLASWRVELYNRGIHVEKAPCKLLESTRMKIASGCFSSCEVGCDLAHIERDLVSADASSVAPSVDFWLELLGKSMDGSVDTQKLLAIPAVKFYYSDCALRGCRCEGSD